MSKLFLREPFTLVRLNHGLDLLSQTVRVGPPEERLVTQSQHFLAVLAHIHQDLLGLVQRDSALIGQLGDGVVPDVGVLGQVISGQCVDILYLPLDRTLHPDGEAFVPEEVGEAPVGGRQVVSLTTLSVPRQTRAVVGVRLFLGLLQDLVHLSESLEVLFHEVLDGLVHLGAFDRHRLAILVDGVVLDILLRFDADVVLQGLLDPRRFFGGIECVHRGETSIELDLLHDIVRDFSNYTLLIGVRGHADALRCGVRFLGSPEVHRSVEDSTEGHALQDVLEATLPLRVVRVNLEELPDLAKRPAELTKPGRQTLLVALEDHGVHDAALDSLAAQVTHGSGGHDLGPAETGATL